MNASEPAPLDRTPRILRATGRVEPLTKPMPLAQFAERLGVLAFGLLPLPALGGKHLTVMLLDADATRGGLPVNAAATQIFHHCYPDRRTPIRGDVAILPDGHFGGFYG